MCPLNFKRRDANSDGLGLETVGVETARYGRIVVDGRFRTTSSKDVYAVGDVVGSGLASAAMQAGRMVSEDLFGNKGGSEDSAEADEIENESDDDVDFETDGDAFFSSASAAAPSAPSSEGTLFGLATGSVARDAPLTLWTLPEIASVGITLEAAEQGAQTGVVTAPNQPRRFVEGRSVRTCGASPAYSPSPHLPAPPAPPCCRGFFKDTARGRLTDRSVYRPPHTIRMPPSSYNTHTALPI